MDCVGNQGWRKPGDKASQAQGMLNDRNASCSTASHCNTYYCKNHKGNTYYCHSTAHSTASHCNTFFLRDPRAATFYRKSLQHIHISILPYIHCNTFYRKSLQHIIFLRNGEAQKLEQIQIDKGKVTGEQIQNQIDKAPMRQEIVG